MSIQVVANADALTQFDSNGVRSTYVNSVPSGATSGTAFTIPASADKHTIFLFWTSNQTGQYITALAGTTNVTWTEVGTKQAGTAGLVQCWRGKVSGGAGGTSVTPTFAATLTSAARYETIEFAGLNNVVGPSTVNSSGASGTSYPTGALTPTAGKETLLLASVRANSATTITPPGAPWVNLANDTGIGTGSFKSVYQIVPSASGSAITATFTGAATSPYETQFASFYANVAPAVTITGPTSGSTFIQGATVPLRGTATDAEDGAIDPTKLLWSSNRDGALGAGASLDLTTLSVGTHTISLSVTDLGGVTTVVTITVVISVPSNAYPSVSVTSPVSGTNYKRGVSVPLRATATDAEDGTLSGTSATPTAWSSDRDGALGIGNSLDLTALSVGTHLLTFTATDSVGQQAQASVVAVITQQTVNLTQQPSGTQISGQALSPTYAGTITKDGAVNDPVPGVTITAQVVSGTATLANNTATTASDGTWSMPSLRVTANGAVTLRFVASSGGYIQTSHAIVVNTLGATDATIATLVAALGGDTHATVFDWRKTVGLSGSTVATWDDARGVGVQLAGNGATLPAYDATNGISTDGVQNWLESALSARMQLNNDATLVVIGTCTGAGGLFGVGVHDGTTAKEFYLGQNGTSGGLTVPTLVGGTNGGVSQGVPVGPSSSPRFITYCHTATTKNFFEGTVDFGGTFTADPGIEMSWLNVAGRIRAVRVTQNPFAAGNLKMTVGRSPTGATYTPTLVKAILWIDHRIDDVEYAAIAAYAADVGYVATYPKSSLVIAGSSFNSDSYVADGGTAWATKIKSAAPAGYPATTGITTNVDLENDAIGGTNGRYFTQPISTPAPSSPRARWRNLLAPMSRKNRQGIVVFNEYGTTLADTTHYTDQHLVDRAIDSAIQFVLAARDYDLIVILGDWIKQSPGSTNNGPTPVDTTDIYARGAAWPTVVTGDWRRRELNRYLRQHWKDMGAHALWDPAGNPNFIVGRTRPDNTWTPGTVPASYVDNAPYWNPTLNTTHPTSAGQAEYAFAASDSVFDAAWVTASAALASAGQLDHGDIIDLSNGNFKVGAYYALLPWLGVPTITGITPSTGASTTLAVGASVVVTGTVNGANNPRQVLDWASSDPAVTVTPLGYNQARLTRVATGSAVVTATHPVDGTTTTVLVSDVISGGGNALVHGRARRRRHH